MKDGKNLTGKMKKKCKPQQALREQAFTKKTEPVNRKVNSEWCTQGRNCSHPSLHLLTPSSSSYLSFPSLLNYSGPLLQHA